MGLDLQAHSYSSSVSRISISLSLPAGSDPFLLILSFYSVKFHEYLFPLMKNGMIGLSGFQDLSTLDVLLPIGFH